MKELEDTPCEVTQIVELQSSHWHSNSAEDGSEAGDKLLGNLFEDTKYGWFSNGSKLTVFNAKSGTTVSCCIFKQRITCVSPFPCQPGEIPLLLVGLSNDSNKLRESIGMICVFNCSLSRIIRAIKMPVGVEKICVINGGAEWEELDDLSIENEGMICVALKSVNFIMVDLKRNSWKDILNLVHDDEAHPADLDLGDSKNSSSKHRNNIEKHSVYNLMTEKIEHYMGFNREEFESSIIENESTTALIYSQKIGCIIAGCLSRIIIWQNDGIVRWLSPLLRNMYVSNLALLEPTDDPRPFCYLWAAYQKESLSVPPILRMYAMLFERKDIEKGINLYYNIEGEPNLKFEIELQEKCRVNNLCPIIRDSNHEQNEFGNKRGEDSLLLISTDITTYLFDLNQWYKEQMPRFIGDCPNVNAIISCYKSISDKNSFDNLKLISTYVPATLNEFHSSCATSPEEFFYPNSLSLEWIELGTKQLTTWTTRGIQSQLLRDIFLTGPIIMFQPTETFHRCLTTGLIAFNQEGINFDDINNQRNLLLTLCLEQRWTSFLLKCAKDWSDGSAVYLYPEFISWIMQRASEIQHNAYQICTPLFDQSGNNIGESEVRVLRLFSQQMECLCNIVKNLSVNTDDFNVKKRSLYGISIYLQVLLWFYDVGLLPETQDCGNTKKDDEEEELEEGEMEKELPFSFSHKIPYPADKLAAKYSKKRLENRKISTKQGDKEEDLFIDELITRECPGLRSLWEQESNDKRNNDGNYPPLSLQSLLRSFPSDCYHNSSSNNNNSNENSEMDNKHQIITYLLMDLVMILQNSCAGVDQLIKYPSAFKLSPSLIKLTQALWMLDNEDYQGFLDIMIGQLVSESDIKNWHHKLIMRVLLQNNQNKTALIYLKIRKPPLNSIEDQSIVINLSVEYGLIQSAFNRRSLSHYNQLLTKFFEACKKHNKLSEILHLALSPEDEKVFMKFLEKEKCKDIQLLYYLQRCRYAEANFIISNDEKNCENTCTSIFKAYRSTIPYIARQFASNLTRKNIESYNEPSFPLPMSHCKSQYKSNEKYETFIKKAKETFTHKNNPYIPFLSAPCSSLINQMNNSDSNCVIFAKRVNKISQKRSADEMNSDDTVEINLENRKRRKIDENTYKTNENKAAMFSTPLIKKKNQIEKSVPTETPQSILKIRQMIRSSTSPVSGKKLMFDDEEMSATREKRPRQIRFSINQPKSADSTVDESSQDNNEYEMHNSEMQRDSSEESQVSYSVPNASGLSDLTAQSRGISGPRPRPSLRKSPVSDVDTSSNQNLASPINMSTDSGKFSESPYKFNTSNVASSTMIVLNTSQPEESDKKRLSTSLYEPQVLSPASSANFTDTKNNSSQLKSIAIYSSGLLTEDDTADPMDIDIPDDKCSEKEKKTSPKSLLESIYEPPAISSDISSFENSNRNVSDGTKSSLSYHSDTSREKDITDVETTNVEVAVETSVTSKVLEQKSELPSIYEPSAITSDISSFENSNRNVSDETKSSLSYHSDTSRDKDITDVETTNVEVAVETSVTSKVLEQKSELPSIYEPSAITSDISSFENSNRNVSDETKSSVSYHSDISEEKHTTDVEVANTEVAAETPVVLEVLEQKSELSSSSIYENPALTASFTGECSPFNNANKALDEDESNLSSRSQIKEAANEVEETHPEMSNENLLEYPVSTASNSNDAPEEDGIVLDDVIALKENEKEITLDDDDDNEDSNDKFESFSESGNYEVYEIQETDEILSNEDQETNIPIQIDDDNITDDESSSDVKVLTTPEDVNITDDDSVDCVAFQVPRKTFDKGNSSSMELIEAVNNDENECVEIKEDSSDGIELVEYSFSFKQSTEVNKTKEVILEAANDDEEKSEETNEEPLHQIEFLKYIDSASVNENSNSYAELPEVNEIIDDPLGTIELINDDEDELEKRRAESSIIEMDLIEESDSISTKEEANLEPMEQVAVSDEIQENVMEIKEISDEPSAVEQLEEIKPSTEKDSEVNSKEEKEDIKTSKQSKRSKRATSVASEPAEEAKKERSQRSTSLTKEVVISIPILKVAEQKSLAESVRESLLSTDSVFDDKNEVPKKKTSRRAASIQKESVEVPLTRTRRGASVTKDINMTVKKRETSVTKEIADDENESVNIPPTRTRRGASVTKDVNITTRKRETSVTKEILDDDENESVNIPPTRTRRGASVAKDVETSSKKRKTSVTKEIDDDDQNEFVKIPATRARRGASVTKDVDDGDVPVKSTRKTRGTSVSKETIDEVPKRKLRNNSVSEESTKTDDPLKAIRKSKDADESTSKENTDEKLVRNVRKTRATSVSKESTDEESKRNSKNNSSLEESYDEIYKPISRRVRKTSVSQDSDEPAPRRTRATSVTKDVEEVISRKTRSTSVTKELDLSSTRKTRSSSVCKDVEGSPMVLRRSTRGSSVTKDIEGAIETSLKTTRRRKGSLLNEVIPEETVVESITRPKRTRSQTVDDSKASCSLIPPIIEEDDDVFKGEEPVTKRGRNRRAASVDISTKNKNAEEESQEIMTEAVNSKSGSKITTRRRAASETKEIKPKTSTKVTRRRKDNDGDEEMPDSLDSNADQKLAPISKVTKRTIKKFFPDSIIKEIKFDDKNLRNEIKASNSKIVNQMQIALKYRKEFIIRR